MRIIAGKAGRMAIKVPSATARPTTDFVRQAIFSILGEIVENSRVLDLFAGSGALGLEALSRGARSCVFVEENRAACATISANLGTTKLAGGQITNTEVSRFLQRDSSIYDLIFADPPYWKHPGDPDDLGTLLATGTLIPRLAPDGWFIAEVSTHFPSPSVPELVLADRRTYGSSAVLFFRHADFP